MRSMLAVVAAIALTALCWGSYGPILREGQDAMQHSHMRPFLFVGLAYFLIGVVVPIVWIYLRGERGGWTATGTFYSLAGGAAGAIGALGIILAFGAGGRPIYVMPLVFGGAPVVNSLLTIYMAKTFRDIGPVFIAGLIVVITGAVTVLVFSPASGESNFRSLEFSQIVQVLASTLLVVVSWGSYGPVLHKGQMKMGGSRLRPLMCVGLAYFAIAVVVPVLLLSIHGEPGEFDLTGSVWSLAAGAAGAIGALGIILAFNSGGRPVYVMPLVFGGAPVVNTFVTIVSKHLFGQMSPLFYAGLILVSVGAAVVLVFAPREHGHGPAPEPGSAPAKAAADAAT